MLHPVSVLEQRSFPSIGFNRYKQQQISIINRSSVVRSSLGSQGWSNNKMQFPIANQDYSRSASSTHRSQSINSNYQNSYNASFRVNTIQQSGASRRYVRDSVETNPEVPLTQQLEKSRERSFIDCERQLQIVTSAKKEEFPLMQSLMNQNQQLVNEQISHNTFHNYDIINPEVKKIIEEFKQERMREESENGRSEPKVLEQNSYHKSEHKKQQTSNFQINNLLKLEEPSKPCQSPLFKNVERQGLYQYMRDCQKLQKCKSDQKDMLFEMSEKLKKCDNSPLQPKQETNYLHQSPGQWHKENLNILNMDSLKVYDSVHERAPSARTKNSVNSSAKQYIVRNSQWDNKENKSANCVKPPQKPLKSFYQRLEHDVTRRQNKQKPKQNDKQRKSVDRRGNTILDKQTVLKTIEQMGKGQTKKDSQLIKNVKSTIDWLFNQVEQKNQGDEEFLRELEQLDQFNLFI